METLVGLDMAAIAAACDKHGVAKLQLFGSGAKGELTPDSDLDFLVEFLPKRPNAFDDYYDLREDLIRITGREVDLVVAKAIRNPYFKKSALAHTKEIYAR